MTTKTEQTVPIVATYNVPLSNLGDFLVTALEGGSNYWYFIDETHHADNPTFTVLREWDDEKSRKHVADAALNEGGYLLITSLEGDEINGSKQWRLDLEACKRGLQLMANANWRGVESCQRPLRFWGDFISENYDAETADIFLQLALFGEIIYG